MEERNTLPWPAIEQLPRAVCAKIHRHLAICETAAMCIQRTWRRIKGIEDKPVPRREAFYGGLLHSRLLKSPTFCSEKLDGTNVGKMRDGTLLGRRMVIDTASTSYMRCPLDALRDCKTDACLDELKEALVPDDQGLQRCALYGELCCNPGLYSYATRKLAKSWQVFGAVFEFSDSDTASAAATSGIAKGLTCLLDKEAPLTVLVANTPALAEMLTRHGIAAVESEGSVSLCELVASKKKWMMSESGEGVVLTIVQKSKSKTYKWKISREPQSGAIKDLTETIESLKPGGVAAHKAMLLSDKIHTLLSDLLEVATHVDSTSATKDASASTKKTNTEKAAKAQAVDPAAVQAALASAVTKFDVFDSTFSAKGKAAIPDVSAMLMEEILGDKDLPIPGGEAEKAVLRKEVGVAVKRFVGEEFGKWQRAQACAAQN